MGVMDYGVQNQGQTAHHYQAPAASHQAAPSPAIPPAMWAEIVEAANRHFFQPPRRPGYPVNNPGHLDIEPFDAPPGVAYRVYPGAILGSWLPPVLMERGPSGEWVPVVTTTPPPPPPPQPPMQFGAVPELLVDFSEEDLELMDFGEELLPLPSPPPSLSPPPPFADNAAQQQPPSDALSSLPSWIAASVVTAAQTAAASLDAARAARYATMLSQAAERWVSTPTHQPLEEWTAANFDALGTFLAWEIPASEFGLGLAPVKEEPRAENDDSGDKIPIKKEG